MAHSLVGTAANTKWPSKEYAVFLAII